MSFPRLVNGVPDIWDDHVLALWQEMGQSITWTKGEKVTRANYFSPREASGEYVHASPYEGFVYTLNNRHVCLWQRIPRKYR